MKTIVKTLCLAASVNILILQSCSRKPTSEIKLAEESNAEKFDKEGEKDADRLAKANMDNLYEIILADKSTINSYNEEVKDLSELLKKAHTRMNAELQELAMKKNITIPAALTKQEERGIEVVSKKSGFDYDQDYLDQVKSKHEQAIKDYQKMADRTEDADIKEFAFNSIIELKIHLNMIKTTSDLIKRKREERTVKEEPGALQ